MAPLFAGVGGAELLILGSVAGAAMLSLPRWTRLPPPSFWLAAAVVVQVFLAAVVGSLPPLSESQAFLSGEGRVLIAWLPLLCLLTRRRSVGAARFAVKRACEAAAAVLAMACLLFVTPYRHLVAGSDGLLKVASSSHHIPGYVGALIFLVACTSTVFSRRWRLTVGSVGLLAVALASSRTAVAGIAIALLYLGFRGLSPRRLLRIGLVTGLGALLVLGLDARSRETVVGFLDGDRTDQIVLAFAQGDSSLSLEGAPAADVNVLRRFGVWGEATRAFLRSPIVGQGPFRLNDRPTAVAEPVPLVYLVVDGERSYSDFGAHNIFLQLAADGGLVLLLPVIIGWRGLWAMARRRTCTDGPSGAVLLAFSLGASLTSNGLTAPALMFPLAALLGPILSVRAEDGIPHAA